MSKFISGSKRIDQLLSSNGSDRKRASGRNKANNQSASNSKRSSVQNDELPSKQVSKQKTQVSKSTNSKQLNVKTAPRKSSAIPEAAASDNILAKAQTHNFKKS